MKVLLSAYACRPSAGSEPGVGFETLLAVAQAHDVWVLTRTKNISPLNEYLKGNPLSGRITPVGIDLSKTSIRLKKRFGLAGLHWYYDRWQVLAAACASDLDQRVRFDLVHHVTFSADWARAGIAALDIPFVWGPIGGEVRPSLRLLMTFGLRGLFDESLRAFVRWSMRKRQWHNEAWEHARVVLVQNQEMVNRAKNPGKTVLLPHGTALRTEPRTVVGQRTKEILMVGRLVPWKGGSLAVRAMSYLNNPHAKLHFIGDGPDASRLKQVSKRFGVGDRIRFEGAMPRDEVLDRVAAAGVLLHPAVHDESPIAVSEALSLGTPVVCLDRGGPPELLRSWPGSPGVAVAIQKPNATARLLAEAIEQFLANPPPITAKEFRPAFSYGESILSVYADVARDTPPRAPSGDVVPA